MNKRTIKWFMNRIGKKVYRNKVDDQCECSTCLRVYNYGTVIDSGSFAQFLHNSQEVGFRYDTKRFK